MTKKQVIIIVLILSATSFALGRYTSPRTETHSEAEQVEKTKTTDTDVSKHKNTVVVEEIKPDGTKTKTTNITEVTDKKTVTETKEDKKSTAESKIEVGGKSLTFSVLVGTDIALPLRLPPTYYGLAVQMQVLGPISAGVWGLSNKTAGVSVGLMF